MFLSFAGFFRFFLVVRPRTFVSLFRLLYVNFKTFPAQRFTFIYICRDRFEYN